MADTTTLMMQHALAQAQTAAQKGEIPVGAIIYDLSTGQILAQTHNQVEEKRNPTAHAEMLAITQAVEVYGGKYLENCAIAVTLEPCAMCAQAISNARISKVFFGAYDPKSGGTVNGARVPDHAHFKPEIIGGLQEEECRNILQTFFQQIRN